MDFLLFIRAFLILICSLLRFRFSSVGSQLFFFSFQPHIQAYISFALHRLYAVCFLKALVAMFFAFLK